MCPVSLGILHNTCIAGRTIPSIVVLGRLCPPAQPCIFLLLPTWAENPVLIAVTDLREPQELHVMKYRRFSPLLSSVSGDLQVLQVTYSTVHHCQIALFCHSEEHITH